MNVEEFVAALIDRIDLFLGELRERDPKATDCGELNHLELQSGHQANKTMT